MWNLSYINALFVLCYIKLHWSHTFNGYFIFYSIKNITISTSINKTFKYWESLKYWKTCLGHIGQLKFSKILIFTWKLKFYNWQQVLFSLTWQPLVIHFWNFFTKCSGLDNHSCVSAISFKSKWCSMKKKKGTSWFCNSKRLPLSLWYAAEVLYAYLPFHHIGY